MFTALRRSAAHTAFSIRSRLIALLLAVVVPAGVTFGWLLDHAVTQAHDAARQQLGLVAQIAHAGLEQVLHKHEAELAALARQPGLLALEGGGTCPSVLTEYARIHGVSNVSVRDASGALRCRLRPASRADEHPALDGALISSDFALGDGQQSDGRWVAWMSSPLRDDSGRVAGLVSAELDLLHLQPQVLGQVPSDAIVLLLDRAGRVLMRSTDGARWVGHAAPAPLLGALHTGAAGFTVEGLDGVRRVSAPLAVGAHGWTLIASRPEDQVLAPVHALQWRAGAVAAAALLLALAIAWAIASRVVVPLRTLAATMQRVAAGERSHRAQPSGPAEVRALATHFNRMLETHQNDEQALRVSEDRLQRAIEASRLSLWDFDLLRGEVWLSESWSTLLGGPPVATSEGFASLNARVPEADLAALQRALTNALRDPSASYRVEHRVRRDDGSLFWNLCEGRVVERAPDGRALRMIGTNRDITERRVAEAALQTSEATLRAVFDNALEAVVRIDATHTVVGWNAQAERTFGWPASQAVGQLLHELIVPQQQRDAHCRGLARFLERGFGPVVNRRVELNALHRDGHEFPIELTVTPVRVGESHEFSAFIRDLSEVRRAEAERTALEAQLRESQKMEAIGTLAGGIAHDFNNILGAILGHTSLIRDDLAPDAPAQSNLKQIHRAGMRARGLVQQILAFSRRQPQQLLERALAPLVNETLGLLRSTLPASVALEAELSDEPLHALADATQLQQVLMNLCTNAWHALNDGRGCITVGLDAVLLRAGAPHGSGLAPGRYARIWVRDDGCGMDAATRERIFEPFFTTKPVGQGTGLGLSVVHGIVQSHQGAITLDSAPGRGSTFHIHLPLVEPVSAAPASEWGELQSQRGHGQRVLYIDDDEVMVLLAQLLLQRAGYCVASYQDARQALDALAREPHGFDLVITDFNMPRLSGIDVAREVARLWPGLPVVVGSGHIDEALQRDAAQAGVAHLLHKETMFADLAPLVHRLLAGTPVCSID